MKANLSKYKDRSFMYYIRVLCYAIFSIVGYLLVSENYLDPLSNQIYFLVSYIFIFVFEYKCKTERFMTLPPTLLSIYLFIQVILAGVLFFKYDIGEWIYFDGNKETINRITFYTLVASHVLWIGFHTIPTKKIDIFPKKNFSGVSGNVILGIVGVSVIALIMGIKLGVYGYSKKSVGASYISYITYLINLGLLAIVLVTAYDFENPKKRRWIPILIVLYFFAGVLFGLKTTAISPMVLFGITMYMMGRKIKISYLVIGVFTIFSAYAIIEPFRIYHSLASDQYDTTNPAELVEMYVDAYNFAQDVDIDDGDEIVLLSIAERQNYIAPLSMAVEYADKNNYYKTEEYKHFFLSPLYAVVPRFIWGSKPLANLGQWISVNIYGSTEENSIGVTPVGIAYMIGRLPAILFFFFIFGMFQKFIFNFLFKNRKLIPVYIIIFFTKLAYPSEPWTYVAGVLKDMLILVPLFYFLVEKTPVGKLMTKQE